MVDGDGVPPHAPTPCCRYKLGTRPGRTVSRQPIILDGSGQAGRVTVRSAGSAPADSINPAVVDAMAESDDPAGKDNEHVRPIRDEIDPEVTALVAEPAPASA
jgi:hypothetical protein